MNEDAVARYKTRHNVHADTARKVLTELEALDGEVFTREQILAAIALRPCHVTGMHTPEHHLDHRCPYDGSPREGYTCNIQLADSFGRLLNLLGVSENELPRELHPDCGWCQHDSDKGRATRAWAGVVEVPAPVTTQVREPLEPRSPTRHRPSNETRRSKGLLDVRPEASDG